VRQLIAEVEIRTDLDPNGGAAEAISCTDDVVLGFRSICLCCYLGKLAPPSASDATIITYLLFLSTFASFLFPGCSRVSGRRVQSLGARFIITFSIWKAGSCWSEGAAHQLTIMSAPSTDSQPVVVSEEDLSRLGDELLVTFSTARIASGAYSGSNHVANPSTSSLPDPPSFRT
jgi:hypothetical protein